MGWNPLKDIENAVKDLEDSIKDNYQNLEERVSSTGKKIESQTSEFFNNPWDWGKRVMMPDSVSDYINNLEISTGIGNGMGNGGSGGATSSRPMSPPTYDDAAARILMEDERRNRLGRAASILSERPADRLGYTGGGYISNTKLGGA